MRGLEIKIFYLSFLYIYKDECLTNEKIYFPNLMVKGLVETYKELEFKLMNA